VKQVPEKQARRVFADRDELLAAARAEFIERAQKALRARRRFTVLLSGGSTPRTLYESLADAPLDWNRVQVFFGDERCVPPDHADSNYRMAREALLSKIAIPERNVHRFRTEDADPERVAKEYEGQLQAFFKLRLGEVPTVDLALMGMGADGHTASLFPGTTALDEEVRLSVAVWVEALKTWRLTLTYPLFNKARCALFLVAGADKAEALRQVLDAGASAAPRLPAARIRPADGELLWWLDAAAAGSLPR
jgi:6-phosphogluconolactonase